MATAERAKLHATYLKHSPTYADIFEQYGDSVPLMTAASWTQSHQMTIPDLIEGGDLSEEDFEHSLAGERTRVHTLPLIMAMGY